MVSSKRLHLIYIIDTCQEVEIARINGNKPFCPPNKSFCPPNINEFLTNFAVNFY
jgi:hypothetical protein